MLHYQLLYDDLGYIKNVDIMYKGTDYTSLPELEIEKPKRNAQSV